MKIILANPRGFCAGVNMAIDVVDQVLKLRGAPVYVYHEIVHNRHVVERLRAMGAVFVEELDDPIPTLALVAVLYVPVQGSPGYETPVELGEVLLDLPHRALAALDPNALDF